jgi:hypothetical protein
MIQLSLAAVQKSLPCLIPAAWALGSIAKSCVGNLVVMIICVQKKGSSRCSPLMGKSAQFALALWSRSSQGVLLTNVAKIG